jgi:transglutaminase-like putative cysteine protease
MVSTARLSAPPLPAVQRYFEVSLFLLVSTGIFAVVSTGKLDIFSTAIPIVVLVYKAGRLWRGRGPELSVRTATGLVLAYFLFFPIDLWVLSRTVSQGAPNPALYSALLAAIHLMLFAALVRLLSSRSNRDYAFLAMLAVTCMLASAILTVETGFLIALAIFLVLAVSTFVALEIRRGANNAVSPLLEPGSPLAHRLHRALGLTSALVAIGTLAIGAVIFFMLPRVTTGYLSALNLQPKLMTGFSDDVTLGEIGEIQKSSAVVMRIHIDGDPTLAEGVHWRGIVLTNFDGRRWFTPPREQIVVSADSAGTIRPDPTDDTRAEYPLLPAGYSIPLHYTVLMEPIATDAIFVAPRIETLQGRFSNDSERLSGEKHNGYLILDHTGALSNPFHNNTKIRYEAASNLPIIPAPQLRLASPDFPNSITGPYLQVPRLDPRIKQLAEQITEGSANEYDKAAKIELYLRTHYRYTLDLTGPRSADPLAYFLFTRRAGHCEYFAAAMTVMLRDLGIPARYVGGFLPGEYNDVGGDWIVRASDAHVWVEVFFPGYGWITFDPTPPGNEQHGGMLERISMYWDWFQFAWGEWIINYDFGHQVTLAQSVQKTSRDWGEGARKYYQEKQRQILQLIVKLDKKTEASPYFLPSILVFLVALLIYLRGRSMFGYLMARWSLRARSTGNVTASLATLEYREMLRLLERRGWKKSLSQTALEFAAAIPASEIAAPVSQLTALYQSARFGDRPAPAQQMSALLSAIREFTRAGKATAR